MKLATAIRAGLGESKTPLTAPAASASPPAIDLDTAQLDQIIGVKGQPAGGVYQFGVPRRDPVSESGMQLAPPGPMGVATAINFQPTGGGKAAITGHEEQPRLLVELGGYRLLLCTMPSKR